MAKQAIHLEHLDVLTSLDFMIRAKGSFKGRSRILKKINKLVDMIFNSTCEDDYYDVMAREIGIIIIKLFKVFGHECKDIRF